MSHTDIFNPSFIEEVRSSDPLNCDEKCVLLPLANMKGDVEKIGAALKEIEPSMEEAKGFTHAEKIAAMRDLGIFIGSLRRHGVQFSDVSSSLEAVLMEMGSATKMIPRDTILHYTLYNPRDERQRVYTPDDQEFFLQESVVMVCDETNECLELLGQLLDEDSINEKWVSSLKIIDQQIRVYGKSMQYVQEKVSPKYFIDELRPYLDEVIVNGEEYLGPAAAQLPMWLFDVILWGARGENYVNFWNPLLPYSPKPWRDLYRKWVGRKSIATVLAEKLSSDEINEHVVESAKYLTAILGGIYKFRSMHLGIAKKSYKTSEKYNIGSAGGSIDLLHDLIHITGKFKKDIYKGVDMVKQPS